jgi:NAD(P)-dependent dehydrogenase (short-subunit alcohol dehydrogenase family)
MRRRGHTPYGPSGAAVEALARIMAADLAGTAITANILLPGGATATGMAPADAAMPLLDPSIFAEPIVWLASSAATQVRDQRIVARDFEAWRRAR